VSALAPRILRQQRRGRFGRSACNGRHPGWPGQLDRANRQAKDRKDEETAMMISERKNELDREIKVYEKVKDRLIGEGKLGKFALIGSDEYVGEWDSYEDALKAGYQKFGLENRFLVKKIEGIEGLLFFTRDIACQASHSS
jgi:hypothetical protein